MKTLKTPELEAGMHAAHVLDLPNCGGVNILWQGTIERVTATDMWGVPSETHHTIFGTDYTCRTVHNTHQWLVRESK